MRNPAAAIALAVCLMTPLEEAHAHASLLSSVPAAGSRHLSAPQAVRLLFSEPIVASLSHATLTGPGGLAARLAVVSDPREVRAIQSALPSLSDGSYRVTWRVVSADGHPVSGNFVFHVGRAETAVPPIPVELSVAPRKVPLLASTLRGLALGALLSACGLLGFVLRSGGTASQVALCRWLSAAATVLLAGHLVAWLVHVSPGGSLDTATMKSALSREVGLTETFRFLLAALSSWALVPARRQSLAFQLALAAVLAGGAIGHSAAFHPVFAIPLKALHLAGVTLWVGGLAWLVSSPSDSRRIVQDAQAVSTAALLAIAVVSVTGIVQGILFLSSWKDIIGSTYGLALVGKFAGLAALAAFGAYHRFSLIPRMHSAGYPQLQRSARREVIVMIAIVMLGGFLAYIPTPSMT